MTKPPWKTDTPAKKKLMIDWVCARLDDEDKKKILVLPEHMARYRAWRLAGGLEKQAARAGYPELLRQRHPDLAEFIFKSQLGRGQKRPRTCADPVDLAVKDVKRIRRIWREAYDGLQNRHKDNGPSAVDIAAARHDVVPAAVARRLRG